MTAPIFISGMPRSGTKLLRDIVNNHSRISIPDSETHFIPEFIRTFGMDYPFSDDQQLQKVLDRFYLTKFYLRQSRPDIQREHVYAINQNVTWASILEAILRYYGVKQDSSVRFGDKTPGYILHLPLLQSIWADIKMVHIVRDPRDCSASVRHAWGMSLRRAAHRWAVTMKAAVAYRKSYPDNYLEVRYEALLSDPDTVIKQICDFVGCEYEAGLSELKHATENLGSVKGHVGLVQTNKNRYLENLSSREIRAIESICCVPATALGYFDDKSIKPKDLSGFQLLLLKLYDGVNAVWFHVREKGLIKGVSYFLKLHREGAFKGKVS